MPRFVASVNVKFKVGDLGVKFMRPPVLCWLWRVPRVMCSDKGLALYIPTVKLSWQKICSLHSGFCPGITLPSPFPSESASASQTECYCRYYHPNFTAGGAKDGVVILCQRFAMSSCCDSQSFGPQPHRSLFTLLLFWWRDQVFSYLEVQRVISLSNFLVSGVC